jgi:diguanylate cyclase (GGDEF)-like protein
MTELRQPGGPAAAASRAPSGATITAWGPNLRKECAYIMAGTGKLPSRARRNVRVLLVGSNDAQLERLREILAQSVSMAFELVHFRRLAEIEEQPEAKEAEVMLLDVCRGSSHGPHSVNEARVAFPQMPVVVLADDDAEEAASRALAEGASGYLLPAELSTRLLVTTLGAAIGNQRARLQLDSVREQARHLATHDQLTGLANRVLFNDRLTQALAAARLGHQKLAILYLDLDSFRTTNDALGTAVGDGLLRGVANQLSACLGETDTAARLAGDEFAILLTQLPNELESARVAGRIGESLARPVTLNHRRASTSASIGIATYPRDGVEADDLVRKAETAMHHAKERGRNRYEFYAREINAAARRRASVESRLVRAIDDGGLLLHYQPQYDLRRERIVGAEALIRWQHPELGFLSPMDFLPIAEESGLIVPIGAWVLRTACMQTAEWQNSGYHGLRISVNVSSHQFREPGFVDVVSSTLSESGLRAESLELEITESSLLEDVDATVKTLNHLKRIGVRLSIDDFGTGYSALAYLKRLPVDVLKIDQSFVRELTTNPVNATITEAVVQLARGLDLTTIAEGVETPEQLLLLGSYGCHRMQGYLFGRPAPRETFLSWLENPPFRWNHGSPPRR